jgi:prevent-host-death family protein
METVITISELRKKTRDILERAKFKGERIIVETSGQPMVTIIGVDEYRQLKKLEQQQEAERQKRFERLEQMAEINAAYNKLSEEEAIALVERAREEVYRLRQEKALASDD